MPINNYQELLDKKLMLDRQSALHTMAVCNELLKKQGDCGKLCQNCRNICEQLKKWLELQQKNS